jgi:hypothetical protein
MAEHIPRERGIKRRPAIVDFLGAGGMSDEEAQVFAESVVRELRSLSYHHPEGSAPTPDEVRAGRKARQGREAHQHNEG